MGRAREGGIPGQTGNRKKRGGERFDQEGGQGGWKNGRRGRVEVGGDSEKAV